MRAELQTSVDKAMLDLSYTTVKAAFDGIVGNKAVQAGQYVQPGTRLLALVPLDTAYIEASYKETQLDGTGPASPPMSPSMPPAAACSMAWLKA